VTVLGGLSFAGLAGQAVAAPLDTQTDTAALSPTPACELAAARPLQPAAGAAKSTAILGGQPSALDRIRLMQENSEATGETARDFAASESFPRHPLAPAAGGFRLQTGTCVDWQTARANLGLPRRGALSSDDFLASKRLAIGRTGFDRDWQRVREDGISKARYRALVGDEGHDRTAALSRVNAWVNERIAYTEDRDLFSRADFWAGANETLKLGRGDCEDIALTKMQLLAAAGIPREDMFLTIARDLVRNADHAVLIVRHEGGYVLLDDGSDELLDASAGHDYRPILSFSERQSWLHGY
jgi:predicted transglutaminase-like cysteine proteinase